MELAKRIKELAYEMSREDVAAATSERYLNRYALEQAKQTAREFEAAVDELAAAVQRPLMAAVLAERHACSITVWMTLMDALEPGADDKGLDGWMREAEARIKARR